MQRLQRPHNWLWKINRNPMLCLKLHARIGWLLLLIQNLPSRMLCLKLLNRTMSSSPISCMRLSKGQLQPSSGGAGPPAVTPHGVAGKSGGARRPESIESAEPTAKRVKLNTAHRSLVLLGHAERFAAQRRWVTGPRRRHRLARQQPSHKKKPWQHKNAVQAEVQNYGWTPSDPSLAQCAILWLDSRVRTAGEAWPCWLWISDSRDLLLDLLDGFGKRVPSLLHAGGDSLVRGILTPWPKSGKRRKVKPVD